MNIYPKLIVEALSNVRYPGSNQSVVELGMLDDDIRIDGNHVSFSLLFSKNPDPFAKSVVKAAEHAVKVATSDEVEVEISPVFVQHAPQAPEKALPQVKHVLAVSSGKGGVGKSTIAANLAIGLAGLGYNVGLLDADVFGPSVPTMFGLTDYQPYAEVEGDKQWIVPAQKFGIRIMSIGFFIKPENAAVWRGPMASNALKQLITETLWGDLDFLVVDTPPGTGDIHLTMLQTLNLSGAIIVSTPQEVALADARKGIDMYQNEKIHIPILGLVENMAWFTPAELPENKYYIFGKGGAARLAQEMNVPLLGQIPLVQSICESGDAGTPCITHPETITGQAFFDLAAEVVKAVEQ